MYYRLLNMGERVQVGDEEYIQEKWIKVLDARELYNNEIVRRSLVSFVDHLDYKRNIKRLKNLCRVYE